VLKLLKFWAVTHCHFLDRKTRLRLKQCSSVFRVFPWRKLRFDFPLYVNFETIIPVPPDFYGGMVIR
jgi:hypothetical protein